MKRFLLVGGAVGLIALPLAEADVAPLPPEFVTIQESFFHLSFRDFLRAFSGVVGNADVNIDAIREPVFDPGLSRNEWLTIFIDRALKSLADSGVVKAGETTGLRSALEDKLMSYYHDEGYARFNYLQVYRPEGSLGGASPAPRTEELVLPAAYPTDHTLDLASYVSERFPQELQSYLRSSHAALYLDDSSCDDALAVQKRDGFSEAVRFMGRLDNPDSQFFFALDRIGGRTRFVACEMHGRDDRTRLAEILGPVIVSHKAVVVHHHNPEPVLSFTEEGDKLRFDGARDQVVIGFQNTVWWRLKNKSAAWSRTDISRGGTDVSVFRNSATGQQILSIANVYGDEMSQALDILYKRGLRRFLYLGTAGALSDDVRIGDVLLPTAFIEPSGSWIPFRNQVAGLLLPPPREVHDKTRQGWVATLVDETRPRMQAMKAQGVAALDVESRYFGEFFFAHADCETAAIITISDQPLGEVTFNQQSATRMIPMDSITRVIEQVIGQ